MSLASLLFSLTLEKLIESFCSHSPAVPVYAIYTPNPSLG